ncbi:hypothetical protein M758_9G057300 [Ceratodon purpureus]|nr:hypothetical protein M758_9G057300 [Ceratodon purpureus]
MLTSLTVGIAVTMALWLEAVAVLVAFLVFRWLRKGDDSRLPPGPKAWPIVGNLPVLAGGRINENLLKLSSKYGSIFRLQLGSYAAVVVASPDMAQAVLKEQDALVAGRPKPTFVAKEVSYPGTDMVFQSYGPSFTSLRKLLSHELLSKERLTEIKQVTVEAEYDALFNSIRHVIASKSSKGVLDLRSFLYSFNMNALTLTGMSERLRTMPGETPGDDSLIPKGANSDSEAMTDLARTVTNTLMIGDLIPNLGFLDHIFQRRVRKHVRDNFAICDAFLQRVVDDRRRLRQTESMLHQERPPRDVLDTLLTLRTGHEEPLSDDTIKEFTKLMLMAGIEPQSATTEWAMAELLRDPKLMQELQEELDRVVGTDRRVQNADLPNLPLLQAIIRETFRMHPAGPFLVPRMTTQDILLGGFHIPANTIVMVHTYGIQHDPAVWSDPDQFLPHRFLHRQGPDVIRGHDFRLLPFGSGRRMCPGVNLGYPLVGLTLARLVHSFSWSLPGELKDRPQNLCMKATDGTVAVKLQPLHAVVSVRLHATL